MTRRPASSDGAIRPPRPKSGGGLSAHTRVALLVGPELFRQAEHTEALRATLTAAHGPVGVFRFDGATAPVAQVLDECRTFGLMEPHKLVIVDNTYAFLRAKADEDGEEGGAPEPAASASGFTRREMLERYIAAPCDSATLLLRSEKGFTLGKLGPAIAAVGGVIECKEPSPVEARRWAVDRAASPHKAVLNPDAADLLIERIGPDLARLDSELAKLATNADRSEGRPDGAPAIITAKAVAEMVGMSREEEVWGIQSALLSGDPHVALRSVREAIAVSRHHPVLVSWACVDLARKLHGAARGLEAGMNPGQLRVPLRLWGPSEQAILGAAQRVRPADAAALLREAVESDVRQKTGASDPERALEVLALRFAQV
ncbi:MAG: DNA polymerase III subunit delta [Phycisphaerales bacterium]